MSQTLFDTPEQPTPSGHRVRALAGVLAGFAWPERGSFERLTKPQQELATETAREALSRLDEGKG